MFQDDVKENIKEGAEKVKDVIEEDIWGSIQDFLNLGFHFGEGNSQIHLTVGALLLVIFAFLFTSGILRWIRGLVTKKMDRENELKFVSIFKFNP